MKVVISKKDIVWSYAGQILYSGVNILLLPFILTLLSSSELGLWYTFTAIGSLAMLIDFGFSTTFTRNVAYAWSGRGLDEIANSKPAESDINLSYFSNLVYTSRKIYLSMGLVILLVFILLGTPYIFHVTKNQLNVGEFILPWIIYFIAVFLNIYFSYWTPLLKGTGSVKEYYQVIVITKVVQLSISIVGLVLGYGLLAVAIAYLASLIVMRILSDIFYKYFSNTKGLYKITDKFSPSQKDSINLLKILWPSVYKQGLISMSNYLTDRSSILIISAFFGLLLSANYGITLQIFSIITTVSNVFYNSHIAAIISDKTIGDNASSYKKITTSLGIQTITIISSVIFLILFGNRILLVFGSNAFLIDYSQLILLGSYSLLFNFQLVSSNYIIMDNKFPMVKSYVISGIVTIVLQLLLSFLFPQFGLWNILIIQFSILIIYNAWKWPGYVSEQNNIRISTFYIDSIKNGLIEILLLLNIKKKVKTDEKI